MTATSAALIAAGAAILSSALTSILTHIFAQARQARLAELKWLDERFTPAISFLANISAILSHTIHTDPELHSLQASIYDAVHGPAPDRDAFSVAILLDPEDTGLRTHVIGALDYIEVSKDEHALIAYCAKIRDSLETLADMYRKERTAILSGTRLHRLLRTRKTLHDRSTHQLNRAGELVQKYMSDQSSLKSTIRSLKRSRVTDRHITVATWPYALYATGDAKARWDTLAAALNEHGWTLKDDAERYV
jgi:hypothetical protein